MLVRVFREHAALGEPLAEGARGACGRRDLDADEQAAAANLGDARRAERAQLAEQVLALLGRALGEALVHEDAQRRAADGGRERVAAERAAVVAGA